MAGNEVVGLDIEARLDQFRAELAKMGDIGAAGAKTLTAKLSKEIKGAEKAAREAGAAARAAAKDVNALGAAASTGASGATRAAKAFGPLGGILARLSPEAGAVSSSIAAATSAAEGFAAAGVSVMGVLAPIGAAVGALALAWHLYSKELEDATAKQDAAAESAKQAQKVYDDLKDHLGDLDINFQVATGGMSEAAAAAIKAQKDISGYFDEARKLGAAEVAGLKAQIAERQRNYAALVQEEGGRDAVSAATLRLTQQLDAAEKKYAALGSREADALAKADGIVAAGVAKKAATEAEAAAKKALADAIEVENAKRAALDELIREETERTERSLELADEEVKASQNRAKHRIAEEEAVRKARAETAKQVAAEAEAAERLAEQERDVRIAGYQAVADAASAVGEQVKEAGAAGFAAWKATALADIAVSTIVGAQRAVADLGPIAGGIAAGLIVAGGAVSAAKVAAEQPSFDDTPGVMQVRNGRTSVSLKDGDHFAAAQNPADLAAQVGGGVTVFQYEHRSFFRYIRDGFKAPTSLSKGASATSGRIPGRRA